MNLIRTVDASSEAISLTDVKNQLRVASSTADHDSFRFYIGAIRHRTETFLQRTLITSTWEYKIDAFCPVIHLPMPPVQSVTTVSYVDTDGDSQTFTDFQVDDSGRLAPAFSFNWPSTRWQFDAVTITYIAGELDAGQVKDDIKYAMLLWIGACDVLRENVVVGAGVIVSQPEFSENILAPYKRMAL